MHKCKKKHILVFFRTVCKLLFRSFSKKMSKKQPAGVYIFNDKYFGEIIFIFLKKAIWLCNYCYTVGYKLRLYNYLSSRPDSFPFLKLSVLS